MASNNAYISQQGTADKGKQFDFNNSTETWNNKGLESGNSWGVVMVSYNIGSSIIYDIKKQKDQLW
jgi:hypothetical protein